jgi:hypothetical protein
MPGAVDRALAACEDADADVRTQAVESLRRMLRDVEADRRPIALEGLRRVDAAGGLGCFPEGHIILGGAAELRGDRAQALERYARGVKELEALGPERRGPALDLLMEARLRLAHEAKRKGQREELERHARVVLDDARGREELVCAPRANRYAGEKGGKSCGVRRKAGDVARELLGQPPR